jgi:hypothetical protein
MEMMISMMFPSMSVSLLEALAGLQVQKAQRKENNRTQHKDHVAHLLLPGHPSAYAWRLRKG